MTKEDFYNTVYTHQTHNRGKLTKNDLLGHFEYASKFYYNVLIPYLPKVKSSNIVDIGCGYGNFLHFLKSQGFTNYQGLDFDKNQVELACSLGLNATTGDWREFTKLEKTSLLSALDFLEHLPREQMLSFLECCNNSLDSDGKIILRVPNSTGFFSAADYFNDLTHEWSFTPASIEALLSIAGFKVEVCLNDRPRLYGLKGAIQNLILRTSRGITKLWLATLGLPMPKVYTKSMWIVASKA